LKILDEMSPYEVLEVSPIASSEEIERAYRHLLDAYESDSVALYSLFGEKDASVIRERIERAYRVLVDPDLREKYDSRSGMDSAPAEPIASGSQAASKYPEEEMMAFEEELIHEGSECNGSLLRRARISAGFELEEISEVTKVSVGTLRHIEADNYADLPATVYVRGFVTGYAQTIGLNPELVVPGYVELVEKARADQGRSRFLGRR
jgi:DnaJ-class molecular chaperone